MLLPLGSGFLILLLIAPPPAPALRVVCDRQISFLVFRDVQKSSGLVLRALSTKILGTEISIFWSPK